MLHLAEFYFPFTSVEGDRAYSATDFATYYHNIFTSGVIATVREKLRVTEDENIGMRVRVMDGAIFIQGRLYLLTESTVINVTPGSSTADRTDSIVVQLDTLGREIKVVYKQGSTNLQRDENIWEMQLATIFVPRNSTSVYNSQITDKRADVNVCGYSKLQGNLDVSGMEQQYESLLEQVITEFEQFASTNKGNLEQLLTDQQALFQTWLSGLQDELDSNQAGNLQNQINQLTADNQVVSITHNLGKYPDVQVLYWEYGLGTALLEEQPEGISFDGTAPETIPVKVVHPSRKRMQIQVPIDYAMTNPTIKQIENNEYILTEGIKSMKILIGVI